MSDAKEWHYDSQAIVCMAEDLLDDAIELHIKREIESKKSLNLDGSDGISAVDAPNFKEPNFKALANGKLINPLPEQMCQPQSRLIILGHGDENSTVIATARNEGHTFTPEVFAEIVSHWLGGRKIKRISFDMCYGGGNREGAKSDKVDPTNNDQYVDFLIERHQLAAERQCRDRSTPR